MEGSLLRKSERDANVDLEPMGSGVSARRSNAAIREEGSVRGGGLVNRSG